MSHLCLGRTFLLLRAPQYGIHGIVIAFPSMLAGRYKLIYRRFVLRTNVTVETTEIVFELL